MSRSIILLLLFLVLCFPELVLATPKSITDSLRSQIEQMREKDTLYVLLLCDLAKQYANEGKFNSANKTATEVFGLASKIHFEKGKALSYQVTGSVLYNQSKYSEAYYYFKKALAICEHEKLLYHVADISNDIAETALYEEDFLKAHTFFYKALTIAKEHHYYDREVKTRIGLAIFYTMQEDSIQVKKHFEKAQKLLSQIQNEYLKSYVNEFYAHVLLNKGLYNKALLVYDEVLSSFRKRNYRIDYLYTLLDKADCLKQISNIDKAYASILEAESIAKQIGDNYALIRIYLFQSDLARDDKQRVALLLKAVETEQKSPSKDFSVDIYQKLYSLYENKGDVERAFFYYKKYNESVVKNDEAKQQKVIKQRLFANHIRVNEEKAKTQIQKEKQIRNIIVVVLLSFILLVFVLYYNYKQKKQDNLLLAKQKQALSIQHDIISEKNKLIHQSISYAQYIQSSILPIKARKDLLENSFVIFKPKDIVSGDFYWIESRDNKVYFTVADCTGHGVPGAFISALAISLLNEIFNQHQCVKASDYISRLNYLLKVTFKQNDENKEIRDGIDMAFCIYDKEQRVLDYAGANRNLWIIRNTELLETKADKNAIGGFTAIDYQFTNHVIALEKGDAIYLSTDGYADQFGGDNRKKMMVRNFKNKLLSLVDNPVIEQAEALDEYFEGWKGANEQIDDVTVMGILI